MAKTLAGTIDLTPTMLKSAAGRALVNAAQQKLEQSIVAVAHVLQMNIDDMEQGTARERVEAFMEVRSAMQRWHKASSDFAFTLSGANPEARECYNFAPDAPKPAAMTVDERMIVWHQTYRGNSSCGASPRAIELACRAAFPELMED